MTERSPRASTSQLPSAASQQVPSAVPDDLSVLLVTAGYDHSIRFWEAWSGICSRTIQYQESAVNKLAISPDKRFIASAGVGVVKLWDCRTALGLPAGSGGSQQQQQGGGPSGSNPQQPGLTQAAATFEGHHGNVTCLAWHCESKWLVTGGEDGYLRIWDTRSPRPQRVYDHRSPINDVVIHPNQGELISCDQSGSIKIWDLAENGCSHELVPEEEVAIRSVTVASDGSCLVAGNNTGNVYVWRIQSGMYPSQNDTEQAGQSKGKDISQAAASLSGNATKGEGEGQDATGEDSTSTTTAAPAGGGDFTDLQPVMKFRAHDRYLLRCVLSPDVR